MITFNSYFLYDIDNIDIDETFLFGIIQLDILSQFVRIFVKFLIRPWTQMLQNHVPGTEQVVVHFWMDLLKQRQALLHHNTLIAYHLI